MEHEIARRRMSRIFDHVAGPVEVSPPNPHLFPMNCSSTLSTMVPRCDNRLLFARQGSASQACFMQQATRQNSYPRKGDSSLQTFGEPVFSRPAQTEATLLRSRDNYSVKQDLTQSSNDCPKFARPNSGKIEKQQLLCSRTRQTSISNGMQWSPRMDVAELGANYVVMVELPGVSIMDMRVEVDDQNLTIIGKRSAQQRRMPNCAGNSNPVYHQREILQGPFRVVWPLPNDVNKNSVSAEFVQIFHCMLLYYCRTFITHFFKNVMSGKLVSPTRGHLIEIEPGVMSWDEPPPNDILHNNANLPLGISRMEMYFPNILPSHVC